MGTEGMRGHRDAPHLLLALSVQGAGGLIKDKDVRVPHQGAGDGHPLPLSPGELPPKLTHLCRDREVRGGDTGTLDGTGMGGGHPTCVIASGQAGDEFVGAHPAGCRCHLCPAPALRPVGNVGVE